VKEVIKIENATKHHSIVHTLTVGQLCVSLLPFHHWLAKRFAN